MNAQDPRDKAEIEIPMLCPAMIPMLMIPRLKPSIGPRRLAAAVGWIPHVTAIGKRTAGASIF